MSVSRGVSVLLKLSEMCEAQSSYLLTQAVIQILFPVSDPSEVWAAEFSSNRSTHVLINTHTHTHRLINTHIDTHAKMLGREKIFYSFRKKKCVCVCAHVILILHIL